MGSRKWSGTARNSTKNDSKAGPVAKAVAAGIAEPSRSHELQQPSLPLSKRNPSSPWATRDTRREELQREAKLEREQARKDKVQEHQQRGAEKAADLEERMRDEVFYHQRDYVDRAT